MTELATESPIVQQYHEGFQIALNLEAAGLVTPVGLDLRDMSLDYDKYEKLAVLFGAMGKRMRWYIGDLLNRAQGELGEEYAQLAGVTGLSEQTLVHYQSVCEAIVIAERRESLSFGCHAAVRRLDLKEQRQWLDKAERGGWSEAELRERMKARRRELAPPLIPPEREADAALLLEVAQAILRDMVEHIDGQHYLVPKEDIARLRAAAGVEE